MTILGTTAGQLWLQQFRDEGDRKLAQQLLNKFKLVSHSELDMQLQNKLIELGDKHTTAVFIEREIAKRTVTQRWKCTFPMYFGNGLGGSVKAFTRQTKVPVAMYKHQKVKVAGQRKYREKATGSALRPVDAQRRDRQEIGSEGIIASIASRAASSKPNQLIVHPTAENIRKHKIRHIVVVTDFIGTGERARLVLSSLWRVRSVRSWYNLGLIRFSVLAYSGTKRGIRRVHSHRSHPDVEVIISCPTIDNAISADKRGRMYHLCREYSPSPDRSLGYGNVAALIAFEHSCPNNVPAIFTKEGKRAGQPWHPLFPARRTRDVYTQWQAISKKERIKLALETLNFPSIAERSTFKRSNDEQRNMILVLAALRRGLRDVSELAGTTGLTVMELGQALDHAKSEHYSDEKGRLTAQGHGLLRDLSRVRRNDHPATPQPIIYHPRQLRGPVSSV